MTKVKFRGAVYIKIANISGSKAKYTLDGEPVDLEDFLNVNKDGLTKEEVKAVKGLRPGKSIVFGGGAAAEFVLKRLAHKYTPIPKQIKVGGRVFKLATDEEASQALQSIKPADQDKYQPGEKFMELWKKNARDDKDPFDGLSDKAAKRLRGLAEVIDNGARKVDRVVIDLFSAGAAVQIASAVNLQNREKLLTSKPARMMDIVWKLVKKVSV